MKKSSVLGIKLKAVQTKDMLLALVKFAFYQYKNNLNVMLGHTYDPSILKTVVLMVLRVGH